MKQKILNIAKENEVKLNALFFIGGVIYDILTLGEIDSFFSILQQIFYLVAIGAFLYVDFLDRFTDFKIHRRLSKIWEYKDFAVHFLLGALLSVYSIFFIKSSSFFSSLVFILFMLMLMVLNELKFVQQRQIGMKIGLYLICVFSFFSMMTPILFGYVGSFPFYTSLVASMAFVYILFRIIKLKIDQNKTLRSALVYPTFIVCSLFLGFYVSGWIPPVPLSVKEIGIYHRVEKNEKGQYLLYYERPKWKFWQKGDQNFVAQPDDKVFLFLRIFSPARFNDQVILRWQKKIKTKWKTTDKIQMKISGGRRRGYRGVAYKKNYSEGDWRILVETLDQREIGRVSFNIRKSSDATELRVFNLIKR